MRVKWLWRSGSRTKPCVYSVTAIALDPLIAGWPDVPGNLRYRSGRLAEAESELRTLLQISPTYGSGHYDLGQVLLAQGKHEAARWEMRQDPPDSGRDAGLAIVYPAMGRNADSAAALTRLMNQRAYRPKDVELYRIKGDPLLGHLEGDPRHQAFPRKLQLPA